jgi:hypothetical protein
MSWPFRTSRAVTVLSPEVEALLRGGRFADGNPAADGNSAGDGTQSPGLPPLPGTFRAGLLAAYERRGGAPSSGLSLLVRDIRWPVASLTAAAAACVVILAGALPGGGLAADRPAGALASRTAASAGLATRRGSSPALRASPSKAGERELAFVGGEWEHVHPLPASVAKVRVVNDQNLPLIGVGWTPDLDGP